MRSPLAEWLKLSNQDNEGFFHPTVIPSFRHDLDHGNGVGLQIHGAVLRVNQWPARRSDRIGLIEGR